MPNNHPFVQRVNELLQKLESDPSAKNGVELANEILKLVGMLDVKSAEQVFESSLELPNAERYDRWFQPHPIFKSDRACFELAESELLQAKFYWLQKHTRQIIAGGVHFTPNFEDEEFTHNERYKVGIDFFLSANGKSLQVVLSNRGNLRVVELNKRLNSTQVDIFTKWDGAGGLSTQEALHTTLWESFKLKSVNQKFYDGVANSFNELLQHLKSIDKDDEEAKLFASRLLGRLLFCWFLRKKGIIDESIGYFDAQGLDSTTYYKSSLERLFFLTLNTPVDERDELQKQHQQQLIHLPAEDKQPCLFKTDQKTPYLNGGLFEPHENDWFNDADLTLPEGYFITLFNHFEEFNFTTDESSPEYEQVAIDPEMLGRVFESLLATQIDETGQQARKAKGAFYTPREIVSYMCKESLRNYLHNSNSQDERYKKAIDDLLDTSDREWAGAGTNSKRDSVPKEYRIQIIDALDTVTILDPACGSGAFPMGMLQLILRTYERLESRFDPYKTKLEIIQNNIFGIDVEPMAVEIARLRAWLSLIVDEEDERSVEPLPNLDFKFVCANSVISLDSELGLFSDNQLHQKLKELRTKYFNARKPHTKKALQNEYYKLIKSEQTSLITDNTRTQQLKSFDPFKNSHPADFFDPDQMFGIEDGFNIIIGNPPYVFARKAGFSVDFKKYVAKNYITGTSKINLFSLFMERGYHLLSSEGNLIYIIQNTFLRASPYKKLREFLVKNSDINLILDLDKGVFDNVTASTTVINYSKTSSDSNRIKVVHALEGLNSEVTSTKFIEQSAFNNLEFVFSLSSESNDGLFKKLLINTLPLSSIRKDIVNGIVTAKGKSQFISNKKESDQYKPLIEGKDVGRFLPVFHDKYILFDRKILHRARADYVWQTPEKLIIRRISGGNNPLVSAYDDNKFHTFASTNNIILKENSSFSIKFILALLNSKLLNWYYVQKFTNGSTLTVNISKTYLDQLPIKNVPANVQENFVQIIDTAISKQKTDSEYTPNSELEAINNLVYDLYDLTPEEIAIIEESVK